MICKKCGSTDQTNAFCTSCGAGMGPQAKADEFQDIGEAGHQGVPMDGQTSNLVSPNTSNQNKLPKSAKRPLVMSIGLLIVVLVIAAATFTLAVQNPIPSLTQRQAENWVESLRLPTEIRAWDPVDRTAIEDGDTSFSFFENSSDRCQSITDIQELADYAGEGSKGKRLLQSGLHGFDSWAGAGKTLSDENSYASLYVGVLSFASEEAAMSYISNIRKSSLSCTEESYIDLDGISVWYSNTSTEEVQDIENSLRINYLITYNIAFLDDEILISSLHSFTLAQFGSNAVFTYGTTDEDASRELGVSIPDLNRLSDEILQAAGDSLKDAAAN